MDSFSTIEMPLLPGTMLDSYQIQEELGFLRVGSPTVVYQARDMTNKMMVAIKVFSLRYEKQYGAERMLARFEREMDLMMRLHHPHILPILARGHDTKHYWYVTPYCPLGTLEGMMEQRDRMPLPIMEACAYAMQMCQALHVLHTQAPPILHRDVKPQNMLFHDPQTLMLSDFGIAHVMYETHLTQQGKVFGTPAYMAPEQLRAHQKIGEEHLDQRVDVYAMGCVLYELLCGQPPFAGAPEAVALAHLQLMPPPLEERNRSVNKGLAWIVQRAMEKDPDDRIPSAQALAKALAPFVEE